MGVIRLIKSDYEMYENQRLDCLVAIERENCKLIKSYFKKYKGKQDNPNDKVRGFKFVMDKEFDSLKIDFSKELDFEIRDLVKVK